MLAQGRELIITLHRAFVELPLMNAGTKQLRWCRTSASELSRAGYFKEGSPGTELSITPSNNKLPIVIEATAILKRCELSLARKTKQQQKSKPVFSMLPVVTYLLTVTVLKSINTQEKCPYR